MKSEVEMEDGQEEKRKKKPFLLPVYSRSLYAVFQPLKEMSHSLHYFLVDAVSSKGLYVSCMLSVIIIITRANKFQELNMCRHDTLCIYLCIYMVPSCCRDHKTLLQQS